MGKNDLAKGGVFTNDKPPTNPPALGAKRCEHSIVRSGFPCGFCWREVANDLASFVAAVQTGGPWNNEWANRTQTAWIELTKREQSSRVPADE